MTCKPGDIVGLPFPFSDLASRKKRPVLVLTQADYRGDFMGLAITSVVTEDNAVSIESLDTRDSHSLKTENDEVKSCRSL